MVVIRGCSCEVCCFFVVCVMRVGRCLLCDVCCLVLRLARWLLFVARCEDSVLVGCWLLFVVFVVCCVCGVLSFW